MIETKKLEYERIYTESCVVLPMLLMGGFCFPILSGLNTAAYAYARAQKAKARDSLTKEASSIDKYLSDRSCLYLYLALSGFSVLKYFR